MCGFPLTHLDKHLKTLVQHQKRFVSMCEEFPKYSKFGEKEFERRVTRIVTPGTLIDEPFLNTFENNYLLSVQPSPDGPLVGLAWIDVSTGEFFSKESTVESLQDEFARIGPKEVVLPASVPDDPSHPVISLLKEESMFYSFAAVQAPADRSTSDDASIESASIFLLSEYLHDNLLESAPVLESPTHETDSTLMQIDAHTIKSLEIREASYVGGTKGTLVSVIRRTTTDSGSRLLARRLCQSPSFTSYTTRLLTVFPGCPSTFLEEIENWQSTVAFFFKRPNLRADIIEKLKGMGDIGRIVQRFTLKRGDISDLLSVKKTIDLWGDILRALQLESDMEKRRKGSKEEWKHIDILRKRILNLESLSTLIEDALLDVNDATATMEEEEKVLAQDTETTALSETAFKWAINPS
jgi:DNA mismatch repair ATPase MutS